MKISAKKRGLVDYTSRYQMVPNDLPAPEFTEEQLQLMDAEYIDTKRERRRNARAQKQWDEDGQKNLKIIGNVNDAISERLKHLFAAKGIEVAPFAREVGMGRTTIHRYINGQSVPSEKKLLRIIDALSMSVADFCYSPHDFEEWKAALEDSTAKENDIYKWRDRIISELSTNDFTVQHHGKITRLPYNYYVVLKAVIENGLKVLDLLPHDTIERKPKKTTPLNDSAAEETTPEEK